MFHRTMTAAALLFAPAAAMAAPEGEKASPIPAINEGLMSSIVALTVFLVVLTVLSVAVWPKIAKGLKEREQKILSEIKAAEMARQQANMALQNYEKSLAEARAEAQRMLEQARAQQQAQAAEIKAKADAELGAMKDKVMRDIDAAKKQALADIYGEAAGLATMVAGKILKREVNSGDQQRLVQDALVEMKSVTARA